MSEALSVSDKKKLERLSAVTLFVLGWMMGKCKGEALDSWEAPIFSLAQALKTVGVECDYVDEILKRAAAEAPKGSAP